MAKEIIIYLMYASIVPIVVLIDYLYLDSLPKYQSIILAAVIGGNLAYLLKEKVEPRLRSQEQE